MYHGQSAIPELHSRGFTCIHVFVLPPGLQHWDSKMQMLDPLPALTCQFIIEASLPSRRLQSPAWYLLFLDGISSLKERLRHVQVTHNLLSTGGRRWLRVSGPDLMFFNMESPIAAAECMPYASHQQLHSRRMQAMDKQIAADRWQHRRLLKCNFSLRYHLLGMVIGTPLQRRSVLPSEVATISVLSKGPLLSVSCKA